MSRFASEQELARAVVGWLTEQHWDVYQEVSTGYMGIRADIVAVQDGISWIIETKRTLSLDLIAQAVGWIGSAHFVSVAIPRVCRESRGHTYARRLLRREGIGVIEAEDGWIHHDAPRKFRRIKRPISDILCDAHKTMAEAGSSRGGYHTPFAGTCRAVRDFVHRYPGCTMREMVTGIEHHYNCDSTARSCLRNWIGTEKIPGIEQRWEQGKWILFPKKVELADSTLGKNRE